MEKINDINMEKKRIPNGYKVIKLTSLMKLTLVTVKLFTLVNLNAL